MFFLKVGNYYFANLKVAQSLPTLSKKYANPGVADIDLAVLQSVFEKPATNKLFFLLLFKKMLSKFRKDIIDNFYRQTIFLIRARNIALALNGSKLKV